MKDYEKIILDFYLEKDSNGKYKNTVKSIIESTGKSYVWFYRFLKKHNIPKREESSFVFNEDIEEKICKSYKNGKQIKIISKETGTTVYFVVKVLKKHGIKEDKQNRNRFTQKQEEFIYDEYLKGDCSYESLAKKYHCTKYRIYDLVNKMKVRRKYENK